MGLLVLSPPTKPRRHYHLRVCRQYTNDHQQTALARRRLKPRTQRQRQNWTSSVYSFLLLCHPQLQKCVLKRDNVQTNTESVQCISTAYSKVCTKKIKSPTLARKTSSQVESGGDDLVYFQVAFVSRQAMNVNPSDYHVYMQLWRYKASKDKAPQTLDAQTHGHTHGRSNDFILACVVCVENVRSDFALRALRWRSENRPLGRAFSYD